MAAGEDFLPIVGYGTDMGNAEDAAMMFAEALEAGSAAMPPLLKAARRKHRS